MLTFTGLVPLARHDWLDRAVWSTLPWYRKVARWVVTGWLP
jgi:hypothetical protein